MNHNFDSSTGIFALGTLASTDDLVADEIVRHELSVDARKLGWVRGQGSLADAYRMMRDTWIADRVVWILAEGEAKTVDAAEALLASIAWTDCLYPGVPIRIDISGQTNWLQDTRFAQQLVMDAIRDQAKIAQWPRPETNATFPGVRLVVRFGRGQMEVGVHLTLTPLSQRGYRLDGGIAPLRETVAQIILMRLGLDRLNPAFILDPCTGSGTLLIEAALRLARRAPQLERPITQLSRWVGLESVVLSDLIAEATQQVMAPGIPLIGWDIDRFAIERARENAERAGVSDWIQFVVGDFRDLTPSDVSVDAPGLIVANPPYGERLSAGESLGGLYADLGQMARQFEGSTLGVVSSDPELIRELRLRPERKWQMSAGRLTLELMRARLGAQDAKSPREDAVIPTPVQELLNRLDKNFERRKSWLNREGLDCYRVYDADLPEFNVVIDRYGDYLHIQEYLPPKQVDVQKARQRRHWIREFVPKHLGIAARNTVFKERFRQVGTTQYTKRDEPFWIEASEYHLRFRLNLTTYTDVGLFLDHRPLRRRLGQEARGQKVLNLFAYTGAFSVATAVGGARQVVSVDLSNTYLEWAMDNFELNDLNPDHYGFIRTDVMAWIAGPPDEMFDLIVLDPPSFSNSKRTESVLDIQRDHGTLIRDAMRWLAPSGKLYFSCNYSKFKMDLDLLSEFSIQDITAKTLDPDFDRKPPHLCFVVQHADHVPSKVSTKMLSSTASKSVL